MTLNEYIVYFVDNRHMAKEDPYFPSQFNAIAIVQADSLDKVFELCNSFDLGDSTLDSHWSHNGNVTLLGYAKENPHNLRSMSVGDVLLDITHHRVYKVLPSGWKQLSGKEKESLCDVCGSNNVTFEKTGITITAICPKCGPHTWIDWSIYPPNKEEEEPRLMTNI